MSYLSIKTIEMQARLDKPYKCETKPSVIHYLERALTGKMTELEFIETELPQKNLTALKSINQKSSYSSAMLSLKLLPLLSDCTLVQMFTKNGLKTEEDVLDPQLISDIITYLSIMSEVVQSYISKVVEMIRSKPGIQLAQLQHNQNKYVQIAFLTNPHDFNLKTFSDIDLYSYATLANIENVLIMQPFMKKIKIADFIRMVPFKTGETMSYNLQSIGLTSRSIFPMNGSRLRLLVKGDSTNIREFSLDFLGSDEEEI